MLVIGFHNPEEEYGYLSNWYLSPFTIDGITYSSMEQYMMHQKAVVFEDYKTASEIMKTQDVAIIKALGRRVSNYQNSIWNGMRQIIVYKGLRQKFLQNIELKKELKSTGSAVLAECAIQDKIWGIGLSMKDPDQYDISKWKGENLLGYTLMIIRDEV